MEKHRVASNANGEHGIRLPKGEAFGTIEREVMVLRNDTPTLWSSEEGYTSLINEFAQIAPSLGPQNAATCDHYRSGCLLKYLRGALNFQRMCHWLSAHPVTFREINLLTFDSSPEGIRRKVDIDRPFAAVLSMPETITQVLGNAVSMVSREGLLGEWRHDRHLVHLLKSP